MTQFQYDPQPFTGYIPQTGSYTAPGGLNLESTMSSAMDSIFGGTGGQGGVRRGYPNTANPIGFSSNNLELRNPSAASGSIADNSNNSEPRIVHYALFYTDPTSSRIQLQPRDVAFAREPEKHDLANLMEALDEPNDINISFAEMRFWNLAQVNAKLVELQDPTGSGTADTPWKSADEALRNGRFYAAGNLHTQKITAGHDIEDMIQSGRITASSSFSGENTAERRYAADLMKQGHATMYNHFGDHLTAGSGLFYILKRVKIRKMANLFAGRSGLPLNRYSQISDPYPPRGGYDDFGVSYPRVHGRTLAATQDLVSGTRYMYLWVPYGGIETLMPSYEALTEGCDPKKPLDAAYISLGYLRHGVYDPSHSSPSSDDPNDPDARDRSFDEKMKYALDYAYQRTNKLIEVIIRPGGLIPRSLSNRVK